MSEAGCNLCCYPWPPASLPLNRKQVSGCQKCPLSQDLCLRQWRYLFPQLSAKPPQTISQGAESPNLTQKWKEHASSLNRLPPR